MCESNDFCKQLNKEMEKLFADRICGSCKNLFYYDWYRCSEDLHNDSNGFLKDDPLTTCNKYEKNNEKFWIEKE